MRVRQGRASLVGLLLCALLTSHARADELRARVHLEIPQGTGLAQLQGLADIPEHSDVDAWGASAFRVMDDGGLVVADPLGGLIKRFAADGTLKAVLGDPKHLLCRSIGDFCVTTSSDLIFSEQQSGVLVRMSLEGQVKAVLDPRRSVAFQNVVAVESGAEGRLIVADEGAGAIYVLAADFQPVKRIDWIGFGMAVQASTALIHTLEQVEGGYRIVTHDGELNRSTHGLLAVSHDTPLSLQAVTPAGDLIIARPSKDLRQTAFFWVTLDGTVKRQKKIGHSAAFLRLRVTAQGRTYILVSPRPPEAQAPYRILELEE